MTKLPRLLWPLLLCACTQLHAAPEATPNDAVLQLLQERGLLPTAAQVNNSAVGPVVQQVRDGASELVIMAMNFLGVPYRRGGDSAEEGFDCSGFTRHVFENSIGLVLPRRADQQARLSGLLTVKRDELKPGDLVFFNTMKRAFSHVGIYVGDGRFIHSPRAGGEVRVEDMRLAYWSKRFNGARRAELPDTPPSTAAANPNP
jgi:cell wall-associated NlpC family hydrolase